MPHSINGDTSLCWFTMSCPVMKVALLEALIIETGPCKFSHVLILSLAQYIFSLQLIRQLVNNIINISCANVCDYFIILVYSNYLLNFFGKKVSFFRNCSLNGSQFGVWSKIFFVITDWIIIIGLHQSIWHIWFTRMTVNETIQVVNMWQAP